MFSKINGMDSEFTRIIWTAKGNTKEQTQMQWTCYMKHELSKKLGIISEFLFKQRKYVALFRLIALRMSLFHKRHICFNNLHLFSLHLVGWCCYNLFYPQLCTYVKNQPYTSSLLHVKMILYCPLTTNVA